MLLAFLRCGRDMSRQRKVSCRQFANMAGAALTGAVGSACIPNAMPWMGKCMRLQMDHIILILP